MPYANGRLPASALSPIGSGGFQLANEAAAAWNAMREYAQRRFAYDIGVIDAYRVLGQPGDLDHGRWSQWAAWVRYLRGGNLAARPGTSNHGLGTTVDCRDKRTRAIIDRIGRAFGFSKSWSDAPTEWWHVRYERGHYKRAKALPTLRKGTIHHGYVRKLQRLLRAKGFKSVRVNGSYDLATRRAVRRVQKSHHMHVDGACGPATWRALMR